jgi:hypothetical protein
MHLASNNIIYTILIKMTSRCAIPATVQGGPGREDLRPMGGGPEAENRICMPIVGSVLRVVRAPLAPPDKFAKASKESLGSSGFYKDTLRHTGTHRRFEALTSPRKTNAGTKL